MASNMDCPIFTTAAFLSSNSIPQLLVFDRGELWLGRFKGSLTQLIQWSPRLEEAINIALTARPPKHKSSQYLFPNREGQQISRFGRGSILRRIKEKALDAGIIKDGSEFQLKDLKAKGISDADNLMLETGELNLQVAGHKQEH